MSDQPNDASKSDEFNRTPGWYDDDDNPALRSHWNGWKWDAIEVKNPPKPPFWRELLNLFTKRRT